MMALGFPFTVTSTRPARPTAASARPGFAENSRDASHFVFIPPSVVQMSCMSNRPDVPVAVPGIVACPSTGSGRVP